MLTADLVRRGARHHRDRVAVICGGRSLTFAEVDELSNRIANALLARGLDRVGLCFGNNLLSIATDFACVKAGIARVPLNPRLAVSEQQGILEVAETDAVVDEAGLEELVAHPDAREPRVALDADTTVLLLATSGTTGTLKLVRHTQRTYAAIVANILANLLDPRPGDAMLHAASLIHASGTFVVPYWLRGGAAVVLSGFQPPQFLDAIEEHGVTAANVVPTMLNALLQEPPRELPTLRTLVYGASPAPRPMLERALGRFGPILTQYYGQTEAPLCVSVLRPEDHHGERLLSCGQPAVDAEVRLDEETNEILVRAPFVAAGYHGDDELHRATFGADGWACTRDVGRFDDDGFLYLVDRTSDMIVTGAYNVYPREVEDALAAHPRVREAVVVGAPDERWVEAVTAFVAADGVSEQELIEHCKQRLASYKAPKSVRFVDEIPKSPVGKLLRRAVRDPLWEGHERPI